MRHALEFLFSCLGLLSLSCSVSSEHRTATVRIPVGELPLRTANGRLAYDCYAVSVTGPGVSPTASADALGSYSPDCLEWGIYSTLASSDQLTRGLSLKIPAGVQRTIKVYGIVTRALGAACAGLPATALFQNYALPELYPLAQSDKVDLLKDTKVVMKRTTAAGSEANILNACLSTKPASEIPASAIKGVKLIGAFSDPNGIQQLALNLSTGAITVDASLLIGVSTGSKMQSAPDGKRVFVWDPSVGSHFQFLYSAGMLNPRSDDLDASAFAGNQYAYYSPSAEFIAFYGNTMAFGRASPGNPYLKNQPSSSSANIGIQFFPHGSYLYAVSGSSPLTLNSFPFLAAWDQPPFFNPAGFSSEGSTPMHHSLATSKGIYLGYQNTSAFYVQYLEYQINGQVQPIGAPALVGTGGVADDYEFALSPNDKFLVVKSVAGSAFFSTFPLSADGAVNGKKADFKAIPYFVTFFREPSSHFLVVASQPTGTNSQVETFTVSDAGILSVAGTIASPLLSLNVQGLVPLAER